MKLSPPEVRRLRLARGWSQEHLAQAAGLSVRTVQRVEADGTASLATATSLAATFDLSLPALLPATPPAAHATAPARHPGLLYAGLAVLSLAGLRMAVGSAAGTPGPLFMALDLCVLLAGLALLAQPGRRALQDRQFAGLLLAALGVPLAMLLAASLALALAAPMWPRSAPVLMGLCGLALVALSWRQLRVPPPGVPAWP
jgi:DNA-binding XRE family transcriptional regulator